MATLALLLILLFSYSSPACALSCDRDFSNIQVEKDTWSYYLVTCWGAVYDSLFATYIGDPNDTDVYPADKVQSVISGGDSPGKYRIGLIIDATGMPEADYTGKLKLSVFNSSGEIYLPSFEVGIKVGRGKKKEITLSREKIRFYLEGEDASECYALIVNNTGNVILKGLKVEQITYDSCDWMNYTEIKHDMLPVGGIERIWICAYTTDNCTASGDLLRAKLKVGNDDVSKYVEVALDSKQESYWEKEYKRQVDKYDLLWKSYITEHAYRVLYNELTKNHTLLLEQYKNLSRDYNLLVEEYANLSNRSSGGDLSTLEEALAEAEEKLSSLSEEIIEKDAIIAALQQKKPWSGGTNSSVPAASGSILDSSGGGVSAVGVALVFILFVVAAFVFMRSRRIISTPSKPTQEVVEVSAASAAGDTSSGSGVYSESDWDRERKKEELRRLLLEKLAEKKTI